jgi:hypothetical protein
MNSLKSKYLILSPALSQSIAIARLLRRHKPGIRLIAGVSKNERFKNDSGLYHEVRIVDYNDPRSIEADTVIPTGALSTKYLCKMQSCFNIGGVTFKADNLKVFDKNRIVNFVKELSIPTPTTWSCFEDIPDEISAIFYKPSREGKSGSRKMTQKKYDIPLHVRGGNFIFQEYIPTLGTYGYAFIAQDGKILCEQQHFEKRSVPRSGGSAAIIETFYDKRIERYSRLIISKLNYSGWGLVEYKYNPKSKDYVFMEVNAKFWASLEFTFRQNPCFAQSLFNIKTVPTNDKGLVWPARLLASGLDIAMLSIIDLIRYPSIFEPNGFRVVISRWIPSSVKGFFKRFVQK